MNKEDLQQIAELMDAKLSPIKSDIAGMKGDIDGMKGDITGMKGDIAGMKGDIDGMKGDIAGMKGDIDGMKGDIAGMKGDIDGMKGDIATLKDDTRQTRVLIEQQHHQIQLIAEQYTDIAEKLDKANERAARMDDFQTRLRAVEIAVMRHSAILKEAQ